MSGVSGLRARLSLPAPRSQGEPRAGLVGNESIWTVMSSTQDATSPAPPLPEADWRSSLKAFLSAADRGQSGAHPADRSLRGAHGFALSGRAAAWALLGGGGASLLRQRLDATLVAGPFLSACRICEFHRQCCGAARLSRPGQAGPLCLERRGAAHLLFRRGSRCLRQGRLAAKAHRRLRRASPDRNAARNRGGLAQLDQQPVRPHRLRWPDPRS